MRRTILALTALASSALLPHPATSRDLYTFTCQPTERVTTLPVANGLKIGCLPKKTGKTSKRTFKPKKSKIA